MGDRDHTTGVAFASKDGSNNIIAFAGTPGRQ